MNTEEAYKYIAQELVERADSLPWASLVGETIVYNNGLSSECWAVTAAGRAQTRIAASPTVSKNASDAAFFLRDDLLKTTGHLCYGFTFTLFEDGKFDIQYRYDNPYKELEEKMAAEQRG